MQALPYATQLLARLGAEVVKVEHADAASRAEARCRAMTDPDGRFVGATFLRNNLEQAQRRHRPQERPPAATSCCAWPRTSTWWPRTSRPAALDRLGLGYDDVAAVHPAVDLRVGLGLRQPVGSPYDDWPAYAPIAEAMSGIYDYKPQGDEPAALDPVGALGDIGSALFAVIGVLAALRHRDATGEGQHVDIAMFDATVAMTDIVTNFGSLGVEHRLDTSR